MLDDAGGLEKEIERSEIWRDKELSWHELEDGVYPPVLGEDINGFKEWLFLKGFRDPDPTHEAFDFSAYKTRDGGKMLGLPEGTLVYSPLDGMVVTAEKIGGGEVSFYEVDLSKFHGNVIIKHNSTGTMSTTLLHIVPFVKEGEYVREGQPVGTVYAAPGKKEGNLVHVHVKMHERFPKLYDCRIRGPIDPLKAIFREEIKEDDFSLERLALPHSGPFTKSELAKIGINIRYERLEYVQRV